MKGNALLFVVEGGVPVLVALLGRAAFLALKKDIARSISGILKIRLNDLHGKYLL